MRVVMFHNVVAEPLDLFDRELYRMHRNRFERAIETMARHHRVVSLESAMAALAAGEDDEQALAITFDDGFAGVYDYAFPVLAALGMSATVFVLTDEYGTIPPERLLHFEELEIAFRLTAATELDLSELGMGRVAVASAAQRTSVMKQAKFRMKRLDYAAWRAVQEDVLAQLGVSGEAIADYAAAREKYRKLSPAEMRTLLAAGWTMGGHTRTHPAVSSLDAAGLEREVGENFREMTRAFGERWFPFAYPYGTEDLIGAAGREQVERAGFACAVTTIVGENDTTSDRFYLQRYSDTTLLAKLTLAGTADHLYAGAARP